MKHDIEFPVDHLRQRALPDAPLAMPRQVLQRPFVWGDVLRMFSFARPRRS